MGAGVLPILMASRRSLDGGWGPPHTNGLQEVSRWGLGSLDGGWGPPHTNGLQEVSRWGLGSTPY